MQLEDVQLSLIELLIDASKLCLILFEQRLTTLFKKLLKWSKTFLESIQINMNQLLKTYVKIWEL